MKLRASVLLFAAACFLATAPAWAAASICDAVAGNLVTNCGFETGDFTGWTTTPAATGSNFGVTTLPPAHDTLGAFFSATGSDFDAISQTFATTPGGFLRCELFLSACFPQPRPAPQTTDFVPSLMA